MGCKVVMTYAPYPGIPRDEKAYERIGAEFVKVPCSSEKELVTAAHDADAVITAMQPFTRYVIERLSKCRLISVIGIGYEGVDVAAATEHGICVCNVPDYCLEEVSDHTMALILASARKLFPVVDAVRAGKWDSLEKLEIRQKIWPPMFGLRGQTLGLIGFGRIPRALLPKAQGFGLRVIAYDPYLPQDAARGLAVELVELDRLLQESDFISVHAPLTPENRYMLGLEQFKRMKATAYFINTARGGLVDEEALYTALSQGYIAGAALDVMEPEPPIPDNPLLRLSNVIVTAHSAHYSDQSGVELRQRVEENVFRVLRREWPLSLVDPQVKEKFIAKWGPMASS